MKKLLVIAMILPVLSFGQTIKDSTQWKAASVTKTDDPSDTIQYEKFLNVVEKTLFDYYHETWGRERAYEVIDSMGYTEKDRPTYADSVYIQRLNKLNAETIIEIEANSDVVKALKYFVAKRRRFTAVCLGRSKMFFPMYKEYLDKYNMPLELCYLSVIESGLRPTVKSRAGATGLWQFMYRTGVMYGLNNDSFVDERMNPEKATDAACRYLKDLYNMYGDWSIALAAYNAGPGNVNKAIRRSGGQMNYWRLRPYLPKETQMYVPNFICMLYMMTYHAEHNILPKEVKSYKHEMDTVCLTSSVRISHIDSVLGISQEEFLYLNPTYKTDFIPETDPPQCIQIPVNKMNEFFELEDSLYAYDNYLDSIGGKTVSLRKKKYHYVEPGETMNQIAALYNVTPYQIKDWNAMRSSKIYPGMRLTLKLPHTKQVEGTGGSTVASSSSSSSSSSNKKTNVPTYSDGKYKYYTLRSGENLWAVSQKLGIPFATIQELNRDVNPSKMQPGDKIRIAKL